MFALSDNPIQLTPDTHGVYGSDGTTLIGKLDVTAHRECWHWPVNGAFPDGDFYLDIAAPAKSLRTPSVFDYDAGSLTSSGVSKDPASEGGGSPRLWKLHRTHSGSTDHIGYVSMLSDTLRWFVYAAYTSVINGKTMIAVGAGDTLKFEKVSSSGGTQTFHFAVEARVEAL